MPTVAEEAAARRRAWDEPVERPPVVRYAFVVWVLAGVSGVVNGIVMLANKQQLIDRWIKTRQPDITDEQIASGASTLLWMFLIAAVVFAVMFTLSAYKAQDGIRRARLMLTVLCLITVAFYTLVLPTALGVLTALLSAAGTVLLYLPAANLFFRPGALPT